MTLLRAHRYLLGVSAVVLVAAIAAIVAGQQSSTDALVREPGERGRRVEPAAIAAGTLSEFAMFSANVYNDRWHDKQEPGTPQQQQQQMELEKLPADAPSNVKACVGDPARYLRTDGWKRWVDFPNERLKAEAIGVGLYFEVWEKAGAPTTLIVAFRGTEFTSFQDWLANSRWFTRYLPGWKDQYTLLAEQLGEQFVEAVAKRTAAGSNPPIIVAAGHSLGGGLAQHFAYSLPRASDGVEVPRVSRVFAFDPSPVTGWFTLDGALRTANAKALVIDRVFEHGEVLAYLRWMQSFIAPPSDKDPSIREIRFNFVKSGNIISSHSMLQLACDIVLAGRGTASGVATPATTPSGSAGSAPQRTSTY